MCNLVHNLKNETNITVSKKVPQVVIHPSIHPFFAAYLDSGPRQQSFSTSGMKLGPNVSQSPWTEGKPAVICQFSLLLLRVTESPLSIVFLLFVAVEVCFIEFIWKWIAALLIVQTVQELCKQVFDECSILFVCYLAPIINTCVCVLLAF